MAPYFEVFPSILIILIVVPSLVMSSDEINMLERFLSYDPLKFSGAISDDTYQFLVNFPGEVA